MFKKFLLLGCVASLTLTMAGCGGKDISSSTKEAAVGTEGISHTESKEEYKIGLVVGTGGLGDQNFNDMAFNGLKDAEAEYGISFDYSEPQSVSDYETFISQYASDGNYDLIIISTNEAGAALEKIADEFPEQKFSIVDTFVDKPNVKSILKDFSQMTFLNGYVAGSMTTETSYKNMNEKAIIGMILGMDIPNMQNGALGFTAGAKYANPDVDVRIGIAGSFADPGKAKEIAKSMYDGGADIILNFAGGSGLGLLNQAKESDLYAMGGASNQNPDAPDNVIASAVEDLQSRIKEEPKKIMDGIWESGKEVGGLKDGYVGITFDGSNIVISEELLKEVEELKEKFMKEEITLPNTIDDVDEWVKSVKE